ncbi:MAG: thiamine pyrophosphate-dependent enzyme [Pseudomonadota bacterium]
MPVPPVDPAEKTLNQVGGQKPALSGRDRNVPPDLERGKAVDAAAGHTTTDDIHHETLQVGLDAYRLMLRIRRFEEKAGQLYGMGDIAGFCHLYIGQEAVATGISMARQDGDRLVVAYRNHGHALASGADVTAMMSELCGRASGLSAGKAGSVHLFWPDGGFYGGNGVAGANAPIGAGLAFVDRYRGSGHVTWCVIGDAALDQGQVCEAMQLAALLKLPIVFVIENNNPVSDADDAHGPTINADDGQAGTRNTAVALRNRGLSFGIAGQTVDGMDVEAVAKAARVAANDVRVGGLPVIIECKTTQYRGHSMADPGKYRGASATSSQKAAQDPIARAGERLLRAGVAEDVLRDIDRQVRDEINAATAFAKSDGEPSADQLVSDIRAKGRAGQTAYRRIHGEPSSASGVDPSSHHQSDFGGAS